MLTGLETIAKIITRYLAIERTYQATETQCSLRDGVQPDNSLTELFEETIVSLYSKVLEYQARCVCILSQPKAFRVLKDIFRIENQDSLLVEIKDCDTECANYFGILDQALLLREYSKQQQHHDSLLLSVTQGFSLLQATAKETLFRQQCSERNEQEQLCLHQLRGSVNYEKNKDRDQQGLRIPNTCRWVLDNSKFIDWRDGNSQGFLLITADAGCGKSVLVRSLIDEKQLGPVDTVVCYYFFRHDDKREAWEMLSILLYQLFDRRPDLIKHAVAYARKDGLFFKSISTLWKILEKVNEDETLPSVVCILDAFDEGSDDWETKRFVDELVSFYKKYDAPSSNHRSNSQRLKFIVTSRPYHEVEMAFDKLAKLGGRTRLCANEDNNPQCIRSEIDLVIENEVSMLRAKLGLREEVADILQSHLTKMENRTYLCVSLILRLVAKSAVSINVTTSKRMQAFLSSIPSGLYDIYEAMLQKIPISEDGENVLKIIVAAVRPLSILEIRIASSIRDTSHSFHDLDVEDSEEFVLRIRNQCGLFITIADDKIYLIHQTARDFLVQNSPHLPTPVGGRRTSRIWQHSLNMANSNQLLALACIQYLCFSNFNVPEEAEIQKLDNHRDFNEGLDLEEGHGSSLASYEMLYRKSSILDSTVVFDPRYWDQMILKRRFKENQFLEYASAHWVKHYRLSKTDPGKSHLLEQSLRLCDVQSNLCRNWFGTLPQKDDRSLDFFRQPYEDKLIKGSEDLLFCSYIGHDDAVRFYIHHLTHHETYQDSAIQDTQKAALFLSIQEGHSDSVRALLLSQPASIINDALMINREGIFQNQVDNIETSALRVAIQNRQLHLVELLLEHGADPNLFGETSIIFDTLQCKAPATEIEKTVSLLLKHHADPSISGTSETRSLLSLGKTLQLSKHILCALSENDRRGQNRDFSGSIGKAENFLYGLQFAEEYTIQPEEGSILCIIGINADPNPAIGSESRLEPWCAFAIEHTPHMVEI